MNYNSRNDYQNNSNLGLKFNTKVKSGLAALVLTAVGTGCVDTVNGVNLRGQNKLEYRATGGDASPVYVVPGDLQREQVPETKDSTPVGAGAGKDEKSWYENPWIWVGVGTLIVGGIVGGILAATKGGGGHKGGGGFSTPSSGGGEGNGGPGGQ